MVVRLLIDSAYYSVPIPSTTLLHAYIFQHCRHCTAGLASTAKKGGDHF